MPHFSLVLTSSSNESTIFGVRSMGTLRPRLPLVSILEKCRQSCFSVSLNAQSMSPCGSDVFLNMKADKGIEDTSPSLLLLKSITLAKHVRAKHDHLTSEGSSERSL